MVEIENIPKKRGRRKKVITESEIKTTLPKKQYRKCTDLKNFSIDAFPAKPKTNLILYLKCYIKDIDKYIFEQKWKTDNLHYNPNVPSDFVPYDETSKGTEMHLIQPDKLENENAGTAIGQFLCSSCEQNMSSKPETQDFTEQEIQKMKELKLSFYKNEIPSKKVDCFWCTCPYDNDPFFILQYGSHNEVKAHCSFCSPQCSVAFLFQNMNWDDSTKMESYQLINQFYNFNNTENIKPAASPFYFLDKFFGNMSPTEFRKMSNTSHVMICVEKPVTRILPEIHEDIENHLTTGIISSESRGNFKVKKQSEKIKNASRNSILRDTFNGSLVSV